MDFEPAGGPASVDIVRTVHGHTSDGRLWHKVTIAGTAADPSGSGVIPLLYLEMRERSSASVTCDIYVGRHDGRLGVFACGTNERLGSARVVRSGTSTIKYVFSRGAIGNPKSYDWAAGVLGPSDGTEVRYDRAPDGEDDFLTHRLR